jgi:hypothetical protein
LFFALLKEVIDEGGVLVLGDAIADGAGIARHLEVLAKGPGQLLTCRLGQGQDSLVGGLDLLGRERLQGDIKISRWSGLHMRVRQGLSRLGGNSHIC